MKTLWIPFTQEQPPKGVPVLVWDSRYKTVIRATRGTESWHVYGGYRCSFKNGTHWMFIVGPD